MNKKDFKKYIEENISGLSLERQIKELQKIQNVYLTEFINLRKKKEGTWIQDKDKDKYIFCSKCQKYYLKSKWKEEYVKEVRTVTTYIDAGYGDYDREGDVEYMVVYHTCPECEYSKETKKHYIKTLREWNRREGRR